MKSDLIDITAHRHAETTRAIFISDDGDRAKAVWVPKMHCEIEPVPGRPAYVTVTMPEWLAIEKGLV